MTLLVINYLLLDCIIKFLQLIIMQYDTETITYNTFCSLSKAKIAFLSENLESIPTEDKKVLANNIINRCKEIYLDYVTTC